MEDKNNDVNITDIIESLPDDFREYLMDIVKNADVYQEAIRISMVGDCPLCASTATRNCEESPIYDNTIGLCLNCFYLWCLVCGSQIPNDSLVCGHRGICNDCQLNEGEPCEIDAYECSIIQDWKLTTY